MAEADHQVDVVSTEKPGFRSSATFIIGGLTTGHGVFHWFNTSFITMLPLVRGTFGLSGFEMGIIGATREVVPGIFSLPGGVLTDMLRQHWGLVLAGCMTAFGLGWLVMGFSPIYPVLLIGMALVAMSASIWHLPAVAALSHHFASRRGSALSFHGVGGNVGDVAAPVVTGVLLGVFAWQGIIKVYAVVPLILAFLVLWAFRDIGRTGYQEDRKPDLASQLRQARRLLSINRLWWITLVAGLRGMAFVSFVFFLPLYMSDKLGFGPLTWGLHLALLQLVGILSTPVMGHLSDRYGRKQVLIPGMAFMALLTLLMVPFGQGFTFIVILALLGTFLFSDQPILTAAALDIAGEGVAATTLGVLSLSRTVLSASSPLIAGALYQANFDYPFYYVAGVFALAAFILLFIPLPKTQGDELEAG